MSKWGRWRHWNSYFWRNLHVQVYPTLTFDSELYLQVKGNHEIKFTLFIYLFIQLFSIYLTLTIKLDSWYLEMRLPFHKE